MNLIRQQRLTTLHTGRAHRLPRLRTPIPREKWRPASVLEQSTHTTTNSDSQGPTRISPGPLRKYRSGEWIAAEWLARDESILAAAWRRRLSVNLSDICPM